MGAVEASSHAETKTKTNRATHSTAGLIQSAARLELNDVLLLRSPARIDFTHLLHPPTVLPSPSCCPSAHHRVCSPRPQRPQFGRFAHLKPRATSSLRDPFSCRHSRPHATHVA